MQELNHMKPKSLYEAGVVCGAIPQLASAEEDQCEGRSHRCL